MPNRIDRPTTTPVSNTPSTDTPTLREGSRGPAVARLQEALTRAGFNAGTADGAFGRGTASALKAFQAANGLTADGVAGPRVWAELSGSPNGPATPPANQGWAPKSNDKVLFVAVNNSDDHRSTLESDALKARGTNVTVVKDAATPDTVGTHDLTTPEGIRGFALTLGLPGPQTEKIADAISHAGPDARDEVANIAKEWANAELGGQIPSRLILSGHHVGYGVYGENNGKIEWPVLGELAEAMPRAARSVEDLMIAGCYSGGQSFMEKYQSMFPNVKTIVAYDGSSPGASSGATAHQKAWEQATRGSRETINRDIFQGMRKGENVTVWTKTHGFQDGKPPASLDEVRSDRARNESDFQSAWDGTTQITDAQRGPVRDYYSATQRMIQHPDTPAAERATLETQRDQTIRLLFYGPVSRRFSEAYGSKIEAGYRAVGMEPPNFKTMTRGQALASIRDFEAKLGTAQPKPNAATTLSPILRDFGQLKASLIPDTWV
ncbi:MAG: peptidoglycan-binding domain-containing protein [Myxococcaceae bacterium]